MASISLVDFYRIFAFCTNDDLRFFVKLDSFLPFCNTRLTLND